MKKLQVTLIIILSFAISSCTLQNQKRHEEFQYFNFNEKDKPNVKKSDIYFTKVTKIQTLNGSINQVEYDYKGSAKQVSSWEFSQKSSKTLKEEITDKAIEYGANYVILFEKKNCENINLASGNIDPMEGSYCYRIFYYNRPDIKNTTVRKVSPNDNKAPINKISNREGRKERNIMVSPKK
ncbi:MAG: hypothetical protein ACJAW3_000777 [Lentimonas sp.]|jgi:hypothetical protein